MQKKILIIGCLAWAGVFSVQAQAESSSLQTDVKALIDHLDQVKMRPAAPQCDSEVLPSCAQISNDFCNQLWKPPSNGNLTQGDTKILIGKSDKSEISSTFKLSIQALLASEERLNADLRSKLAPILKELRKHLEKEEDSDVWYRKLGSYNRSISDAIEDLALERTIAKQPALASIKKQNRNFDQDLAITEAQYDIQNEILNAKYAQSPNWQRVTRLFEQVRKDVLEQVAHLNVPAAKKSEISEKLTLMKLRLPYADPRLISSLGPGCDESVINAFYMPDRNVFTLCAGWLNGLQDDASVTFVIAHEMTHSFDPMNQALDTMMKSDLGKTLNRLCAQPGAPIPCEEWNKIKEAEFKPMDVISEPKPPFRPLTSCLHTEEGLAPFDTGELKKFAKQNALSIMSYYATNNIFSYLAQPTIRKDGIDIPNEIYFRPDRKRTHASDGSCLQYVLPELFTQSLGCTEYRALVEKTRSAPESEREILKKQYGDLVSKSLEETARFQEIINQHWYSQCGRDCSDLLSVRMGRNSGEETADWMAKKILAKAVEREQVLAKRRQIVATSASFLCDRPGPFWGAGELTSREKQWSFESHPEDRLRRLSFFTPEIAKLIRCTTDDEIAKGNFSCDL